MGKELEGPKGVNNYVSLHDDENIVSPSNDIHDDIVKDTNEIPRDHKHTCQISYTPPLYFPQRMAKAKLNLQFRKFLEVLKKLYINIPFTNALS